MSTTERATARAAKLRRNRLGRYPDAVTALAEQIESFESFLTHERRASASTVRTYGRDLRALASFAEEMELPADARRLDIAVLRAFLGRLFDENGPSTLARKVSAIRSFYRFLVQRGVMEKNPAATLKPPKVRKPLPRFLTVEDSFRVCDAPDKDSERRDELTVRDRAVIEVLYGCGLRVSEMHGLNLSTVDLRAGVARVIGKGNKEREVPVGSGAADAIRSYLVLRPSLVGKHKRQDPDALFLSARGSRLSVRQIQNIVKRYGRAAGGQSDLHPHALRHTCATHLLDAGADLRSIQVLLGHASLSTTQRYTHVSTDRLMAAYDAAHPLAKKDS